MKHEDAKKELIDLMIEGKPLSGIKRIYDGPGLRPLDTGHKAEGTEVLYIYHDVFGEELTLEEKSKLYQIADHYELTRLI
jgi:hypothetical protein